jgi:hypothetical protein
MRIRLVEHAKDRANERGASEDEVSVVLLRGQEVKVKKGRKGKELVFDYNGEWLGKHYPQKKIRVIYVEVSYENYI